MTPDERRDHILELADEIGAVLIVDADELRDMYPGGCTTTDPCAYVYGRSRPFKGAKLQPSVVMLSHDPGSTHTTYLVALHELGHIATGFSRPMLEREVRAWRWALSVTRAPLTQEEWRFINHALASYSKCQRCKASLAYTRLLRLAERKAT